MMGKYRIGSRTGGTGPPENKIAFFLALVLVAVSLVGCNIFIDNREDPSPTFEAQIISDDTADGDIGLTPPAAYTISSALDTGNVLAGVDPASGDEFRGFLDFPLRGSHGVPWDATIESATLEIFISGVSVSSSDRVLPFIIDLVAFQPPVLAADDFDRTVRPPLLTMPFDFYPSDAGAIVVMDVTALMEEAQFQGLPDFQLRFLLDFSATSGLIEIDDSDLETAPLLTVSYF
jgi:hypothetical protein